MLKLVVKELQQPFPVTLGGGAVVDAMIVDGKAVLRALVDLNFVIHPAFAQRRVKPLTLFVRESGIDARDAHVETGAHLPGSCRR